MTLTDHELLYAATARCACGAGMAYPLDASEALRLGAWLCSDVLKGNANPGTKHDELPFAIWKVREETSINNTVGTTRPVGTIARTVGLAHCPACHHEWSSEPYDARGLGSHWQPGPCPQCGHDEAPISLEARYRDVVLDADPESHR